MLHHQSVDVTPFSFRQTLGCFATGVTVVTTALGDGRVHAMTANAFCAASLDPPLVLISLDQKSRMHDVLARSGVYGVSVLASNQEALSRHFAGCSKPDLHVSFTWWKDCPLLAEALVWLVCRVTDAHPAGDHTLYIGQVESLHHSDKHTPLLFYRSVYTVLASKAHTSRTEPQL